MRFIGILACAVTSAAIIALVLNPETIPFAVAMAPCGALYLLATRFADRCFVPPRMLFRLGAFCSLVVVGMSSSYLFHVEAAPVISAIAFYFGVGFVSAFLCSSMGGGDDARVDPPTPARLEEK